MKKSYSLTYGVILLSYKDTITFLSEKFDIIFDKYPAYPAGVIGLFMGNISIYIQENFDAKTGTWSEFDDCEFPIIVYLFNTAGTNKDKLSMHKFIKSVLWQYDNFTLLREEVTEIID